LESCISCKINTHLVAGKCRQCSGSRFSPVLVYHYEVEENESIPQLESSPSAPFGPRVESFARENELRILLQKPRKLGRWDKEQRQSVQRKVTKEDKREAKRLAQQPMQSESLQTRQRRRKKTHVVESAQEEAFRVRNNVNRVHAEDNTKPYSSQFTSNGHVVDLVTRRPIPSAAQLFVRSVERNSHIKCNTAKEVSRTMSQLNTGIARTPVESLFIAAILDEQVQTLPVAQLIDCAQFVL